jgi:electron transport complex protein RnfE
MIKAPGAFVCLGLILAGMNVITAIINRRHENPVPKQQNNGCDSCASCGACKG